MNLATCFQLDMGLEEKKRIFYVSSFLAGVSALMGFFSIPLAVGLFLIVCLAAITLFGMQKSGVKDVNLYVIFLIALAVHVGAVLFIYYSGFGFGGGADFTGYHQNALDVLSRFRQGNFSLDGLGLLNYYPVLIAVVYVAALPEVIVGNLFSAWLAALSVALVYAMVLEIGGTKKSATLAGLLMTFYPSYLYFGSVLLKDTAVIPLVIIGMLFLVRMLKRFSWPLFLVFFVTLTALIHLRFYVGYALLLTLTVSWPMMAGYHMKKRMAYWVAMVFLLGFSPLILGSGYYGSYHFKKFLNPDKITYFREVVYTPTSPLASKPVEPVKSSSSVPNDAPLMLPAARPPASKLENQKPVLEGSGSTFVLEAGFNQGPVVFFKNSTQSFIYSLLGPFPWQLNNPRQAVALAEIIPWYLLIGAFFYQAVSFVRKHGIWELLRFYKAGVPLVLFSILALGALSLFINNYGIIVRIRMPMFICLASLMCSMLNGVSETCHGKISSYWRSRIHWLSFIKNAFGAKA